MSSSNFHACVWSAALRVTTYYTFRQLCRTALLANDFTSKSYSKHTILFYVSGAINVSAPEHFSEGVSPGLLHSVTCSGTETEILECSHMTSSTGLFCNSSGVVCQGRDSKKICNPIYIIGVLQP